MTATGVPAPPATAIPSPPPPQSFDDLGVPFNVVCDLALKVLYFNGSMNGRDLTALLCIPFSLVEPVLKFLSDEELATAQGMRDGAGSSSPDASIRESLHWVVTSRGRGRAREVIGVNQYAGAVPIPIEIYMAVARHQARTELLITEERLRAALSHLVLSEDIFESLGPALNARHTLFLYGPPGNGKTAIAEACSRLMGPPLFVPRALWVHGEIVRFFDPVYHAPINLPNLPNHDIRWVAVHRPAVLVGGELSPDMLELSWDPSLGFYEASAQLKANGGLFLVDDFGRQTKLPPRELLNRLIVPLEKGVDYLHIARAASNVAVPFTTTLVLSTNLHPEELMDEAFLRRIRFKVLVAGPDEAAYRQIWFDLCSQHGIGYNEEVIDRLVEQQYLDTGRPFRGVHARDLLSHVVHSARYQEIPVQLSDDLIDAACRAYFVRSTGDW